MGPTDRYTEERYFDVSLPKYCAMSICTLALYDLYWAYKNWKYIKDRDHSTIIPFLRAIFLPITYYWLLKDISATGGAKFLDTPFKRMLLALAYVFIGCLAFLPGPFSILSLLVFVPIMPAVRAIGQFNINSESSTHRKSTLKNYLTYLFGGSIVLLLITSVYWEYSCPACYRVIAGDKLTEESKKFLRENGLLDQGDEIILIYSAGVYSLHDDGQFLTDSYVVSYEKDEDGSLTGGKTLFEKIHDISVDWSDSFWNETHVTIIDESGYDYLLWLSTEGGGDKKFVEELKVRWNAKKELLE